MSTKALLIDNYDSCTQALQLLSNVNGCPPAVVHNYAKWDALELAEFRQYR